jgi:Rhodopirellula transposase DDE domain
VVAGRRAGPVLYTDADALLLLGDGGGSNSARTYLFKADLEKLVQEIGIEIRVAHSPSYTSKYNPIEHRLFPHLTRAGQGVIFTSIDLVKDLMTNTTTKTG